MPTTYAVDKEFVIHKLYSKGWLPSNHANNKTLVNVIRTMFPNLRREFGVSNKLTVKYFVNNVVRDKIRIKQNTAKIDPVKKKHLRVIGRLRYEALKLSNGRCQLCGSSPKDGIILNVDHIKPRKKHPELALNIDNLQVLCNVCNHGKGNTDDTDWR